MTDTAPVGPVQDDLCNDAANGLPCRHLRLLGDVADGLLAADDAAAMVEDLFALIATELRLDMFLNYRRDGDTLVLAAHGGLSGTEAAAGARLAVEQAVCGTVARERRPIEMFAVQASDDPMVAFLRDLGIDAYACAPLLHGPVLLGTLGFGRRWADRFDADELAFLRTVSHYVALAKYRLKIEAELRDGITSREALLAELNHRVRNALQTAVAVVRLGAADTVGADARAALAAAASRLEVLAAAHRPLYATDTPQWIDMAGLITAVAERADGGDVAIEAEAAPALPVEQAAAAALLVHSLLSGGDAAVLGRVRIAVADDRLTLALAGDGLGRPHVALDETRLVRGLARQLRATLARDGADVLTLAIPMPGHG